MLGCLSNIRCKVYLDAVFFPRAINDPLVLAQEGWHYEIEKKDDPLTFKGVVFNEMKGLYSNPDALHGRTANQSMFPDNQFLNCRKPTDFLFSKFSKTLGT